MARPTTTIAPMKNTTTPTANASGLAQPLLGYCVPNRALTSDACARPLVKYQVKSKANMTVRDKRSSALLSGASTDAAQTITITRSVAIAQILAADAFAGSPSACQFFMCKNAPKTGLNKTLQLAAAFGFHNAGAL
jgi:hypothetical protein